MQQCKHHAAVWHSYSLPACTPASPNAPQNARNVLVASDPSSACSLTAKLADLGLSRSIKLHATHHTTCTVRRALAATGCLYAAGLHAANGSCGQEQLQRLLLLSAMLFARNRLC